MSAFLPRLQGRRVALTRTAQHNLRLAALLREEGAQLLEVPLTRFARSGNLGQLHARLHNLSGIDWLLLTSPQAVSALFEELAWLRLDARALQGLRVAAVGGVTAQALQARGLSADFVPSRAGASVLAAELPAQPGQRALHLTSPLSEGTLQAGLQRRGVLLERLELYQTQPAELSEQQREALAGADAVTLASGSAAQQLAQLGLTHLPVAVMGPQTAQTARAAGFTQVVQADVPTLESLVTAVIKLLGVG